VENKRVGRKLRREEESEQIEKESEGRGERHPPVAGKSPQTPQGQSNEMRLDLFMRILMKLNVSLPKAWEEAQAH
jgi:hypothetical protein